MLSTDVYLQMIAVFVGFDLFIIAIVLYFEWYRKRDRLMVRIKSPIGEQTKWIKPEKDGKTLVVEKAKGRKVGWSFTFSRSSLYYVKRMFRKYIALDVIYDAPKAIEYDFKTKESVLPVWDRSAFERVAVETGFKMLARMVKIQLPMIFWLMIMLQIVIIVLIMLNLMGVRLGAVIRP